MSLLKYFKREGKGEDGLPNHERELSSKVSSSSILSANNEVKTVLDASKRGHPRGPYDSFTPEERAT